MFQHVGDPDLKTSVINVRRTHIWEDSCRHLCRKKFQPNANVSIKVADDDGSSEGAIDAGGPRREYLRLLVRAVNIHSGIFCGPQERRVLFPNATGTQLTPSSHKPCSCLTNPSHRLIKLAILLSPHHCFLLVKELIFFLFSSVKKFIFIFTACEKGYYHLVGLILGWSLAHGGPGPSFFSTTLYNTIAYGFSHKADLKDIPDPDMQEKLMKVI